MATNNNIIKADVPLQSGDTYTLKLTYKENGVAADLPAGQDLVAAFYDCKGNLVQSARLGDGTLQSLGNHIYAMELTHEASARMTGQAFLELTIATDDLSLVDHAKQVVEYWFEPRRNNKLLGGQP